MWQELVSLWKAKDVSHEPGDETLSCFPDVRFGPATMTVFRAQLPNIAHNGHAVLSHYVELECLGEKIELQEFASFGQGNMATSLQLRIQQTDNLFKHVELPEEIGSQILTYLNRSPWFVDESVDCGRFALFAHSYWLNGSGGPEKKTYDVPVDDFKCTAIQCPEPGDLVLFLTKDHNPRHFGVGLGGGLILAKMGRGEAPLAVTSVEETHKLYGTEILAKLTKKFPGYQASHI
jgi:hypothetical protein